MFRRLAWTLGLIVVATGLVAAGVRFPLPALLADRVRQAAAQRGVDVQWARATASARRVTLSDVRLSGRVVGRIGEVRIAPDWSAALRGELRARHVVLRDGAVTVAPADGDAAGGRAGARSFESVRAHDVRVTTGQRSLFLRDAAWRAGTTRLYGRAYGVPFRARMWRDGPTWRGQGHPDIALSVRFGGWTAGLGGFAFSVDPRARSGWAEVREVAVRGPVALDLDRVRVDHERHVELAGQVTGQAHLDPAWRPDFVDLEWRGLEAARGRVSSATDGRLVATTDPGDPRPTWEREWLVDGWIAGRVRVDHPRLADEPVEASGRAAFSADLAPGRVALRAELAHGEARAAVQAALDERAADVTVGVPVTPCAGLLGAAPRALLGPLGHAAVQGRFGAQISLRVPRDDPFRLQFQFRSEGNCAVTALNLLPAAQPRLESGPAGPDVAWLSTPFVRPVPEATRPVRVGPGTPGYTRWSSLPAHVRAAMWVSEDVGFHRHGALSVGLIRRALKFNLERSRFVYGGSTITQQLAKNLFLTREKTVARKVQEAIIALRLFAALDRTALLELYVNCIEFAPNIYGVHAAAWHYFRKPPQSLTPMEAVFLARAKPSPRYAQQMRAQGRTPDTEAWRRYNANIFEHLVRVGAVTPETAQAAAPYALRWSADGRAHAM